MKEEVTNYGVILSKQGIVSLNPAKPHHGMGLGACKLAVWKRFLEGRSLRV